MYQCYHRHSFFSNPATPDSVVSNEEYALRAKELGHKVISGCEHATVGRYIEGYELAKKYDLKFVFGLESYIVKDRFEKDKTNAHIILLAKNENGRKAINRIISEANLSGFYYRARIDFGLLYSLPKDDVWVSSACLGGVWKYPDADDMILDMKNYFGSNFFLEVQNHNVDSQRQLNSHILDLHNEYKIPLIFGTDSHYIYPNQAKDRDDYLLSKHIVYEDENNWYLDYPDDDTAKKRFEIQGILSDAEIDEAMNNTNILLEVEEYTSEIFQKNVKLPTLYPDKTQNEKNKIFEDVIWNAWNEEKVNIPEEKRSHYIDEIKKEIKVVIDTKMADYFLIDREVVAKGKALGGTITMTGRGSAPSFYLCKLLGLTTIDRISSPVKLFPERFMTTERILEAQSLPDIDANLGTPEIFAKAQDIILGENHSYPMSAYGTFSHKAAWKLFARAKDIEFSLANNVSSQIEKYEMELKHTSEDEKDEVNIMDFIDEEYHEIFEESKKYLGIVSDSKIHPCAYLLYQKDIKEEIGIIKIKDHICTIMDGLWAENYKFLKNDLLKVSVVDLIYKVYDRIGIAPHPFPELQEMCKGDKKVWDVYKNAWTMGINQVEQKSTSGRVAKYGPKNISELSAFVASVRPGFKSNYKQFEAREPFSYGIPSLDNIIQTEEFPQSYLLYQENCMQVLAYAGIPINQTYEIIKNIAKKRVEKVLKYKEQFLKGMTKKIKEGESRTTEEAKKVSDMIWQILEDSSRYNFNSSHAYSVAGDSLYGAYLKSHYPFEFYETFLRMLEEDADKDRLMAVKNEANSAFGIIFPPFRFGQDNRTIVAKKEENQITSSLASIKGFGKDIGENMYKLGLNHYDTFVDFLIDAEEKGMFTSKIENLIDIKYFDIFGGNKKQSIFYKEFTKGKSRYSPKYKEKTKAKRIEELRQIWEEIPDENFSIGVQIEVESDILGYVQATYPVDKRYFYVKELDTTYSPRFEAYCLATGKSMSLKIQKKKYYSNPFGAGEILYGKKFTKKAAVKFVDNKYVEDENGEMTWWLDDFDVIPIDKFDKETSKHLTKT